MKPWPYYSILSMPLLLAAGIVWGGWWWWSMLIVPFGVVPAIDHLIGPDRRQPERDHLKQLEQAWSYRIVLYVYAAVQFALLAAVLWKWHALPEWERVVATIVMGVMTGGLGITIAHELVHRTGVLERGLGYALLCSVWYGHFGIEHVVGHHKNAGLHHDPATARKGESAYAFVVRSAVMGWIDAFRIEQQNCRKHGTAWWGFHNRVVLYTVVEIVWTVLAVWFSGTLSAVWFVLGQSIVAILLLELVNYVEHYGLRRNEISSGVLERFGPTHAWESRFLASNYLLFKLQRHADHHMNPQRRYQMLHVHDNSPQLPSGYPVMVVMALVPPLWYRLIHPRLPKTASA